MFQKEFAETRKGLQVYRNCASITKKMLSEGSLGQIKDFFEKVMRSELGFIYQSLSKRN